MFYQIKQGVERTDTCVLSRRLSRQMQKEPLYVVYGGGRYIIRILVTPILVLLDLFVDPLGFGSG